MPGLDYVSHEDILPYTSTDQVPIQHELFERFLLYDQTKGNLSGREAGRRRPFLEAEYQTYLAARSSPISLLTFPVSCVVSGFCFLTPAETGWGDEKQFTIAR